MRDLHLLTASRIWHPDAAGWYSEGNAWVHFWEEVCEVPLGNKVSVAVGSSGPISHAVYYIHRSVLSATWGFEGTFSATFDDVATAFQEHDNYPALRAIVAARQRGFSRLRVEAAYGEDAKDEVAQRVLDRCDLYQKYLVNCTGQRKDWGVFINGLPLANLWESVNRRVSEIYEILHGLSPSSRSET